MKLVRIIGLPALLVAFLIFPLVFSNPATTTIAVFALIFAIGATAWNMFSGYTGYISLGHAVFFGFGAYTFAIICQVWDIPGGYTTFLLLIPAGLVAAIVAFPLGWIALRTRRHTFVVVTIAMLFIMQLLAYNLSFITHGSGGMYLPLPPWSNSFFNVPFYYVALLLLVLAVAVSWWIRHSKFGLGLLAIRDDEDRALGLGVKTGAYKLTAMVISALFVGMVGALLTYFSGQIYPPAAFSPIFDIQVALMSFLGGVGTLVGPVIGALILEPLQQYIIQQFGEVGLDLIVFGAIMLAILLFLPQGIVPSLRRLWEKRQASRTLVSAIDESQPLLVEGGVGGEH